MKLFRPILMAVLFLFSLSACKNQAPAATDNTQATAPKPQVQHLSATDFSVKLNSAPDNSILVDVRTPEEYAEGHIEGAVNINFYDEDFESQIGALNKDVPVFVYCQAGSRSRKACAKFEALGFKEVYDLEVGYSGWSKSH